VAESSPSPSGNAKNYPKKTKNENPKRMIGDVGESGKEKEFLSEENNYSESRDNKGRARAGHPFLATEK